MSGTQPSIAEVAALVGNPARANMLSVLLDGRALTATELAHIGGVSPQTASGHLGKLMEGGLLVGHKQGRHNYFRLASPLISQMLEGIMAVAAERPAPRNRPRWRGEEALRLARTCYDHLAGRLGVALADALVERGYVLLSQDGGMVTASGEAFFADFGIDLHQHGANAVRIWRARSARRWPGGASSWAGSPAYATPGRWRSPPRAAPGSRKPSG